METVKSLLESQFVPRYDPFIEYFESLPEWKEGDPDYIGELATYVKTDNQEFWASQLKKALVRSVGCSTDRVINRMVIVLVEEAQKTGKTSFIRWLCPPALKKDYYTEEAMDTSKTDSQTMLSDCFMWNFDEMSTISKQDIGKLKTIISKDIVNARRSYRADAERYPRRVNFWGTTNNDDFLAEGQNTRWICFKIISIDHDYNNWKTGKGLDINKIWSQAYALYHAGFNYDLDAKEASIQKEKNVLFQSGSIEKDLILSMYKVCAKGEGQFLMNAEILMVLQQRAGALARLNAQSISKTMKQIGFIGDMKKINGVVARGWHVKAHALMPGDTSIPYDAEQIDKDW
jgi:predicted P-loop ATPase